MSIVENFIRRKPKDILNILTFPTHETYEKNLAKTGHSFFSFQVNEMKRWNQESKIPDNYHLMPYGNNKLFPRAGYDLILAQSRFGQFQVATKINEKLNIPIIALEHTTPTPDLTPDRLKEIAKMVGDVNVFISVNSAEQWNSLGINRNLNVIEHCVDLEVFNVNPNYKKERRVISVANQFENRDYCLNFSGWKRIVERLPFVLFGDNPNLSQSLNPQELAVEYNKSLVFLNTSTFSPIPMSLLEAMACGCAVVSMATCAIPDIIQNGVNGFISNDEKELEDYCKKLLEDPELAHNLGQNAAKTIKERFSEGRFLDQWNEIFKKTYEASL
jgi:glycosyltransferase involved in cell wall biosynthesis